MYHNSPETKVVCSELNTKITYKHEKFNFDEEVFEEGYSSCGVIVVFINIVVAGYYRKKGEDLCSNDKNIKSRLFIL